MLRAVSQRLTVSPVTPANTAQEAVHQVPAAVTVRWVGTPQWLISLGLGQTTVSLAMQADTVQEAVQRVIAVVTARRVATPQWLISLGLLQTTA